MKRPKRIILSLSLSLFEASSIKQIDREEKCLVTQINDGEYGDQRTRKRRLLLFYAIFHARPTTSRNTFSSKCSCETKERKTLLVSFVSRSSPRFVRSSRSKNPANVSFSSYPVGKTHARDRASEWSRSTSVYQPIVITCRLAGNILSGCRCFQ